MIDYKQRYLQKLENDINEKIYDLLIQHLQNVHSILPKHPDNKKYLKQLHALLFDCLERLKKESNKYNYLQHYRYSILIINTLLSYKPDETDLKRQKMIILDKFSSLEPNNYNDTISLAAQMTELRITFDVNYLLHITEKHFIPKKIWDKAMYCLIAIELIEPDHPKIDEYKKLVLKNLKRKEDTYKEQEHLNGYVILLDTNIALTQLLQDIDNYSFPHYTLERYIHLFKNLQKTNAFMITPSVKAELDKNLEFSLAAIKDASYRSKKFNEKKLTTVLNRRFSDMFQAYSYELPEKEYSLHKIEKFYSKYLGNLYEITLEKIEHQKLSKKLKKLSDRNGLLPEQGDMNLLFEAIQVKKEHKKVAILSNDKDLYMFNNEIEKKFGIKVLR